VKLALPTLKPLRFSTGPSILNPFLMKCYFSDNDDRLIDAYSWSDGSDLRVGANQWAFSEVAATAIFNVSVATLSNAAVYAIGGSNIGAAYYDVGARPSQVACTISRGVNPSANVRRGGLALRANSVGTQKYEVSLVRAGGPTWQLRIFEDGVQKAASANLTLPVFSTGLHLVVTDDGTTITGYLTEHPGETVSFNTAGLYNTNTFIGLRVDGDSGWNALEFDELVVSR
jgi:hypothetical protein